MFPKHLLLCFTALVCQSEATASCTNSHLSCPSTDGRTCNPCHPYAKMLHADPCFPSGGKFRCLGQSGFQTMECDCSVSDCGCSTGPALTACSSKVPGANMRQYLHDVRTYCRMDREHTLCKYKDGATGRCGNKVCARGFTEEAQKNRVVDKHNEFRRQIAEGEVSESSVPGEGEPSAANMEEVVWDDEIARIAQRWADQCHGLNNQPHDEVRSVKGYPHHGFCGQNVFSKSSSHPFPEVAISEAVTSWFQEVDNFDPEEVEHFGEVSHSTGEVHHFTSLIWAKTYAIGCGYVVWEDAHSSEYPAGLNYHQVVVCNYCPGGNAAGEGIYEPGHPASHCPPEEQGDDGLCVRDQN